MSRSLAVLFALPLAATVFLGISTPVVAAAAPRSNPVDLSDQQNDRDDRLKAPADARIERQDIEVVESTGKSIPNPLTPQRTESFVIENFTTTKPGRLLVTKSMELTATCTPTSGVIYFLMVDGVAIRNSATFSRTGFVGQMSGVTTETIAAGPHTITVGEYCTVPGAYPSGATVTVIGITSVVVLP